MPPSKPPKPAQKAIPTPFIQAPDAVQPFLQRLDTTKVHITHIDRLPPDIKKRIFLIPVLLNLTIAGLLCWRLVVALPYYATLAATTLGYTTPATVDVARTTRRHQFLVLLRRTAVMAADYLLFRFVGPWPLSFFAEQPANPVSWRWKLRGFRREEVVVRVSRRWHTADLMQGVRVGDENAFFKTRVLPAIDPVQMRKTGYLMMNESWDLELELMGDAHALVERGELRFEDLDRVVWAFLEGVGWLAWKWDGAGDVIEGRRKKVVAFKEKLTAMGKESLFWRWTEIVEEERDADGGFTWEGQGRVAARVRQEFERNGVDFEAIAMSIGGLDELPASK
jgi:hypothetical protein